MNAGKFIGGRYFLGLCPKISWPKPTKTSDRALSLHRGLCGRKVTLGDLCPTEYSWYSRWNVSPEILVSNPRTSKMCGAVKCEWEPWGEESILDCLSNQGVLDVYVVRGKVRGRQTQQGSGQLKCCTVGLEHEYRLQQRKVASPRGSSRPKPQQHLTFVIAHLSCFKSPNVWLYLINKTAMVNICPWRTSQTVTSRKKSTLFSLRDTLPWARLFSSSFSLNSRVSVSLHRHGKGREHLWGWAIVLPTQKSSPRQLPHSSRRKNRKRLSLTWNAVDCGCWRNTALNLFCVHPSLPLLPN